MFHQIPIRSAHAADPVYSLQQSRSATNFRGALMSLLQGADPLDPKAPLGPHPNPNPPKGPKGTRRAQGERKGAEWDPKGPKGPKGAFGALGGEWAHGALWGLFRSHFEWKVISNGRLGPAQVDPKGPKGA